MIYVLRFGSFATVVDGFVVVGLVRDLKIFRPAFIRCLIRRSVFVREFIRCFIRYRDRDEKNTENGVFSFVPVTPLNLLQWYPDDFLDRCWVSRGEEIVLTIR